MRKRADNAQMKTQYAITMYSKAYVGVKAIPNKAGKVEPKVVWTRTRENAAAFSSQDSAVDFIRQHHLVATEVLPFNR